MSKLKFDTQILAEIAITVALSVVLNYIKIFQMPYGGSVTLGSMVPVLLISFRRGPKIGIITGIIFGLVQMSLSGWVYHPLGMFLDYPLAFGVLGLAGFLKNRPMIGVVTSMILRFLSHFISGVVFFAMYAPPEMGPVIYSIAYNGAYMLPETIISVILIYLLVKRDILDLATI